MPKPSFMDSDKCLYDSRRIQWTTITVSVSLSGSWANGDDSGTLSGGNTIVLNRLGFHHYLPPTLAGQGDMLTTSKVWKAFEQCCGCPQLLIQGAQVEDYPNTITVERTTGGMTDTYTGHSALDFQLDTFAKCPQGKAELLRDTLVWFVNSEPLHTFFSPFILGHVFDLPDPLPNFDFKSGGTYSQTFDENLLSDPDDPLSIIGTQTAIITLTMA